MIKMDELLLAPVREKEEAVETLEDFPLHGCVSYIFSTTQHTNEVEVRSPHLMS